MGLVVKGEVMHDPIEGPKVSVSFINQQQTPYAYEVWVGDAHAFATSAEQALEMAKEMLGRETLDPEGNQAARLAGESELSHLCRRLRGGGVAQAVAEYGGTSDEGWVQEVALYDGGKKVGEAGSEQWGAVGGELEEAVRAYVYTAIEAAGYSGYENNEGGGGKVSIDSALSVAVVEHYQYLTEEQYEKPVVLKVGADVGP